MLHCSRKVPIMLQIMNLTVVHALALTFVELVKWLRSNRTAGSLPVLVLPGGQSFTVTPLLSNRPEPIMLQNLPIMLCCTAPKMYLLCSINVPIMLKLCSLSWLLFSRAGVGRFVTTLTFLLRVNSDCVGDRSWLSSDVGERVVACCELLPAA